MKPKEVRAAWITFPLFPSQESLEDLAGGRRETLEENRSEIFRKKKGGEGMLNMSP